MQFSRSLNVPVYSPFVANRYISCISFFQIKVSIAPGTHISEEEINKQLADKERVAAALENPTLRKLVDDCLIPSIVSDAD
ncbi:MIP18 family protein At1g68310 [Clonorchis sinensis]|uniref:MIP18 family protein At1g68310 n=1 Tax=Clonorchis sinensis TaxID=79923 RepID=G7YG68_CLOSI|nr:MIP18 family protein At1g68310 [Clonorchis sinensis]